MRDEPRSCGGCGYDLSGLGMQGHCPECGRFFDMMSGEGLSRASGGDDESASERHRRGERVVRRLGGAFMLAMAGMALACGGVLAWMAENWQYPLATGGLIALMFAIAAANWYLGEDDASSRRD